MYFNVISDTGSEIDGYLVPDGFSAKPSITVTVDGEPHGPFFCDVYLEGPKRLHHHETGIVGFKLSTSQIPGLTAGLSVEIGCADTGIVFYRRYDPARHIEKRVFRLETQFVPHSELDISLKPYFQFHASSVEQYGSETIRQSLEVINQPSTYVSGRILLRNVQDVLTQETVKLTSLRDPFYELAVRLSVIASFKRRPFSYLSKRDEIIFEPAMEYFSDMNLADEQSIADKIKYAPSDVLDLFESPFTRQLVASSPSDTVARESISTALDVLSQFTVFDPEEKDASFASDLAMLLGIERERVRFFPMRQAFIDLADKLRRFSSLEHLLENDLILYFFIKKAKKRSRKVQLPPIELSLEEAMMEAYKKIAESEYFDLEYYCAQAIDVKKDSVEAAAHYFLLGADAGYDPSPKFSSRGYLICNPDVGHIKINPLLHYEVNGKGEGPRVDS